MPNPLDFTGKVVLVTGSSRGIGAEMTKGFGKRGATCVVNYFTDSQGQNKADAERVAKELNDPLVIDCDVTQPQQVEAMMKQIQDRHGGLDILVNNSESFATAQSRRCRWKNSKALSASISQVRSTS